MRVAALLALFGCAGGAAVAGDPDELRCYRETVEVEPTSEPCTRAIDSGGFAGNGLALLYYNRGVVHFRRGATERAIADFRVALELAPGLAPAYNNSCYALAMLQRYDEALRDCERALALAPKSPYFLDSRGFVQFRRGDFAAAISDFTAAIEVKPDYALAYYHRALAHDVRGEDKQAIEDYRKAYELDPENPDYARVVRSLGLLE